MNSYGERIKAYRMALSMSQSELASKVGYSDRSAIAKIETGVNDITVDKLKEIADVLHVKPSILVGWEDEE